MTDNVAGMLCYIPFFVGLVISIVFLVVAPYNQKKFVRFHAFQSIFVHVALIAIFIVKSIAMTILFAALPLGLYLSLAGVLGLIVWLASLALIVLLMVKAYQNQEWEVPVIGPMAKKQA